MNPPAPDPTPAAVALVSAHGSRADARAGLGAALARAGHRVGTHDDGDPAILRADAVVALGDLSRLTRTAALLRAAGRSRPRVAAWAHEPLLPPLPDSPALRLAERLATAARGLPGHSRLWLRTVRPAYAWTARRGLGPWCGRLTAKEVQFTVEQTVWLRRALQEGLVDLVAASTCERAGTVASWGFPSVFVPASHDFHPEAATPPEAPRDIDVLFLGRLTNPARRGALDAIARALRHRGARVAIHGGGLHGAARDAVLARTRVLLHLAKYPWDTPWLRWFMAATHGVAMASEPLSLPDPFVPGTDFLQAPVPALADAVTALLADEPRRQGMAAACRARVAASMTLDHGAARLMAALRPEGGAA
jgi:glycosyltransferase involved in cell wall biosynthesis